MPQQGLVLPQFELERLPESWRAAFAHRVEVVGECWVFTGCISTGGYGRLSVGGKIVGAHRHTWKLVYGPIPMLADNYHGTCVCHRCDNRACIRPAHLFIGTHTDNMRDMESKGRSDHPSGDRQGLRRHPEARAFGDRNGSRRHPERRPRGSHHANAVLSEQNVQTIRSLYESGGIRQADLAERFGVSQVLVSQIVRNMVWRHV